MGEVCTVMSWAEIIVDPSFKEQPDEVKQRVATNYFNKNITSDPSFKQQPQEVQDRVLSNFLNTVPVTKAPVEEVAESPQKGGALATVADVAVGTAETIPAFASGVLGFVAGQGAKLGETGVRVIGGQPLREAFVESGRPGAVGPRVTEALTYHPRTRSGAGAVEMLAKPFELYREKYIPFAERTFNPRATEAVQEQNIELSQGLFDTVLAISPLAKGAKGAVARIRSPREMKVLESIEKKVAIKEPLTEIEKQFVANRMVNESLGELKSTREEQARVAKIEKAEGIEAQGEVFLKDGETIGPLPESGTIRVDQILPEGASEAPKVLYHGTKEAFPLEEAKLSEPRHHLGPGFYASENPKIAGDYARGEGGNIKRIEFNAKKTFDFDNVPNKIEIEQLAKKLTDNKPEVYREISAQIVEETGLRLENIKTNRDAYRLLEGYVGREHINEALRGLGYDSIKAGHEWNMLKVAPEKPVAAEIPVKKGIVPGEEAVVSGKISPVGERSRQVGEEVSRTVDEFRDEYVPPAGLSVQDVRHPEIRGERIVVPQGTTLRSISPTVEGRWQAAKGVRGPTIRQKVKKALVSAKNVFTRHYEHLDPKKDGAVTEVLRQSEVIPEGAKTEAHRVIDGITAGLGKKEYEVFTRNVILPDLLADAQAGKFKDGFPFGYKSVAEIGADFQNFKSIAEVNPKIAEAMNKRNTYMEALKRDLVDAGELSPKVLDNPSYFHHQVLAHMQFKDSGITGGGGVRPRWRGWKKGRVGSSKDYNTQYVEAEFEVVSQALENIKRRQTLERVEAIADVSKALKIQAKRQGVKDWKELGPEDYVEWQPEEGSAWFKANSITENILDELISGAKEFEATDVKSVIAKGRKRRSIFIPERLAMTLDELGRPKIESKPSMVSKFLGGTWKIWTLLNPMRVVKYFTNNMSGDLDISLAYSPIDKFGRPKILKEVNSAYKELLQFHKSKRAVSKEFATALDKGITSSGITVQDIPDITSNNLFKAISGGKDTPNLVARYWRGVKEFNTFRENILRLAAFKHFRKEIARGEKPFGVSKASEIEALYKDKNITPDDIAAKLSRELIGDYGNLTVAGQWMREQMVPFYSWMEINAPRYVRLMKNLPHEGRSRGKAGAIKLGFSGTRLMAKAAILSGLVNIWNHTMFPEEEARLGDVHRRQLHIIVGNRSDGTVRTIRFQGALSDALSWLGAEDLPSDIRDVAEGRSTIGEKAEEALLAPVQKLVSASRPIVKTLGEALLGRSLYPDITNPRVIRDPFQHVARTFSVDAVYNFAVGKPTRGLSNEVSKLLFYDSDPGEAAYNSIRTIAFKWLDKHDIGSSGFIPSKKANAIYYYKMALKYGDEQAANKFLREYVKLGGDLESMNKSVVRSAPLGFMTKWQQDLFLMNLSKQDEEVANRAYEWYVKTFMPFDGGKK